MNFRVLSSDKVGSRNVHNFGPRSSVFNLFCSYCRNYGLINFCLYKTIYREKDLER